MPEFNEKLCKKCGFYKSPEFWYVDKSKRDGLSSRCKECVLKCGRHWYKKNRSKAIAYSAARQKTDKGISEKLKRKFGITIDDYKSMLSNQGGVCAICLGLDRTGRRLAVDHEHSTGRVRGLLCGECNQGLGKFQDNCSILYAAAKYVERGGFR